MIQFLNHKNSSSNQLKVDEWSNQNKGKNTGDYMRLSIFILYCCISVKIRYLVVIQTGMFPSVSLKRFINVAKHEENEH